MLQSNNSGGTNFDQELVSVDTMNNNADGDNNYNNNGGTNFDQELVPVGTMNNNADGDSNYNYNNNGGANFDQQLVPGDTMNNNGGTNFDQQLVPVDMMNNNAYGDNNYNINGATNFGEEEFDSANTTEIQDGGGSRNEGSPRRNKRKRYHRHTHHQIQEMEAFFKECPHPDDKQRKELSRQLGLDPLQIKFWFQNKRTQNKNHQERHENAQLRTDNERLRAENMRCYEAIASSICPNCRGQPTAIGEMSSEEHHLRIENSHLHEEVGQLSLMAEKWTGNPVRNYPVISSIPRSMGTAGREIMYGNGENLWRSITGPTDADKPMIIELAAEAMEELMTMAQVDEPLWMGGINGTSLVLNFNEYTRTFGKGLGPRLNNGFRSEASKDTAMVLMNHTNIVTMLMDVNQWSMMFGGMIARAMTHEVLLTGVAGNLDGSVQLMSAEFKVLSPLVPTRESYFVRYCKQHGDGLWAVVDVSIDHLFPNLKLKCRKRPSGCLVQETPNGFSKVTWIEHVEVDDRGGVHYLYQHLIATGQAFGANRWVGALDRQCERLACIIGPNFPSLEPDGLITIKDQTKSEVLKLAERMTRGFFAGVATSNEHTLRMNSGGAGDDVSITTSRSVSEPGRPPGNVLCAAASFWVPIPPKTLFDFLRDENNRTQWDILSSGGTVHKISQIANGRDVRNCVTVLRGLNANQTDMIIVQESSTNPTASFVIYAPVDIAAIESVFKGGESDYVAVLPSGFAILPDGTGQRGGGGGSLITASFQMLVDSLPSSKVTFSSVATIESLIRTTMHRIKTLFPYHSA